MAESSDRGQKSFEIGISALLPADSPRTGIDHEHVRALAESDAEFPPILVHRQTMRVVDGMHRLRAMALRGCETITASWFDGDEKAAFLRAVEANVAHGLPLSLEERKVAALRILESHPDWSDRGIAAMTGLNAKSVGLLRRTMTGGAPEHTPRIGRDGRVRPASTTAGRAAAAEVIRQNPAASLREIARLAGISVGTARDVRRRLADGAEPVPGRHAGGQPYQPPSRTGPALADRLSLLNGLYNDPSLRLSENGRSVLQQLRAQLRTAEEWKRLAPTIPMHGRGAVAEILSGCAADLMAMAEALRRLEDSMAG